MELDCQHSEYLMKNWGTRPDTSVMKDVESAAAVMSFGDCLFGDIGSSTYYVDGQENNIFGFRKEILSLTSPER